VAPRDHWRAPVWLEEPKSTCQERVALYVYRLQVRDAPPADAAQQSTRHGSTARRSPADTSHRPLPLHIVSLMDIRLFIKAALIGIAARTTLM
jgi:hypothetical protein